MLWKPERADQHRAREEADVNMLYMLDEQLLCQDCGAKVGAMKSPMSEGEGFVLSASMAARRTKRVLKAALRWPVLPYPKRSNVEESVKAAASRARYTILPIGSK